MSLTKAQREILKILKEVPGTAIVDSSYRAPKLLKDGQPIRTVNNSIFHAIRPWLQVDKDRRYFYTFREDAEISDAWLQQEQLRVKREQDESIRQLREAEKLVGAEKEARFERIRQLLSGNGIEFVNHGSSLAFTFEGKNFSIRQWGE